ncbi:hypothetical protein DFH09DRAFT_1107211 [Mycena vulgaris]|nr:hypothetical protein DFH09DRAFT_1107211 [Mycena vulgaris]
MSECLVWKDLLPLTRRNTRPSTSVQGLGRGIRKLAALFGEIPHIMAEAQADKREPFNEDHGIDEYAEDVTEEELQYLDQNRRQIERLIPNLMCKIGKMKPTETSDYFTLIGGNYIVRVFYERFSGDPNKVEVRFLKSRYLVRPYKAVFIAPSSAEKDDGDENTRPSKKAKAATTPPPKAGTSARKRADSLLTWWNKQIFPTHTSSAATHQTLIASRSKLREQHAAMEMVAVAAVVPVVTASYLIRPHQRNAYFLMDDQVRVKAEWLSCATPQTSVELSLSSPVDIQFTPLLLETLLRPLYLLFFLLMPRVLADHHRNGSVHRVEAHYVYLAASDHARTIYHRVESARVALYFEQQDLRS